MQNIIDKTIILTKGDTFKATVGMVGDDGTPYSPQEGDVVRFHMKKTYKDTNLLIEKIIPNDTLLLQLDSADTSDLDVGKYVYDIQITYANGDVDTFIDCGTLKLTEEVEGIAPEPEIGYTLLKTDEHKFNTASTAHYDIPVGGSYTSQKIVYVKIRDKAGKQNGYCYGSDTYIINPFVNAPPYYSPTSICCSYKIGNDGNVTITEGISVGHKGIFAELYYDEGPIIAVEASYDSTKSGTINGTYLIEIYTLDWPDGISPFIDQES